MHFCVCIKFCLLGSDPYSSSCHWFDSWFTQIIWTWTCWGLGGWHHSSQMLQWHSSTCTVSLAVSNCLNFQNGTKIRQSEWIKSLAWDDLFLLSYQGLMVPQSWYVSRNVHKVLCSYILVVLYLPISFFAI